jgi:hypothetical protein
LIDVHFRKMRFQIPAFLNFLTNRELYWKSISNGLPATDKTKALQDWLDSIVVKWKLNS